jgi:hypothetical protein
MDKNIKDEIYQQISIFNFGQSIAQSFLSERNNKVVFKRLETYLKLHSNTCDEETLATVMALQENVSSLIDESGTRGQGFTDLLNFFAGLCSECTQSDKPKIQMSIVSGHTSIYLDGKYLPVKDEETGRHLLFFNQNNDSMHPPDKNYVKKWRTFIFQVL